MERSHFGLKIINSLQVPMDASARQIHDYTDTFGTRIIARIQGTSLDVAIQSDQTHHAFVRDGLVYSTLALDSPFWERVLGPLTFMHIEPGALVIHASAVSGDEGVTIFLGESGVGKSTTAYQLAQLGKTFLCDDVACVDSLQLSFRVGPRRSWLWKDGVKTGVEHGGDVPKELPITRIVDLQRGDEYRYSKVSQAEAYSLLLTSCWRFTDCPDCDLRMLANAKNVVSGIPVYRFVYPTASSKTPEHVSILYKQIR